MEFTFNNSDLSFVFQILTQPNNHVPRHLITDNINWNKVAELIQRNKLSPFLNHIVSCQKCNRYITKKYLKLFNNLYWENLCLNQLQSEESKLLQLLFKKRKIKAYLLKDYTQFGVAYPSCLWSEKKDMDFFVESKTDLPALEKLLIEKGYQTFESPFPKDKYAYFENDYLKKINNFPIFVNLHSEFLLPEPESKVNPLTINMNKKFTKLFLKSMKIDYNQPFYSGYYLIYHCLHYFFRDRFSGLKTLYDLSLAVKQIGNEIDWENTLKIANKFKVDSYLLFVLNISCNTFGTPLPQSIIKATNSNKRVKFALKLYHPFVSAYPESSESWHNIKLFRPIIDYRFFIKLILWQEPWYKKIGPRSSFMLFKNVLPTYSKLKRLNKNSI